MGADGIWSVVRGQLHNEPPGKESATYSGYTCFTGVCEARPDDVKEVAYKVYLAAASTSCARTWARAACSGTPWWGRSRA